MPLSLASYNRQLGYALHGLGVSLLVSCDLAGARAKLEEALALRTRVGAVGLVAESRATLAEVALERNAADAAVLARAAAAEFGREKESDQQIWAQALYARCLATQGEVREANQISGSIDKRLYKVEDIALRVFAILARARVKSAVGNLNEAQRAAQLAYDEAVNRAMLIAQLEARLILAELDRSPRRRSELAAIEKEATGKGFGLIARKAVSALRETDTRPR